MMYSLDVLHMPPGASTIAADPKLPPESSKHAGFLPAMPVTKEPHFRLSGQALNPYSSSQKRNGKEHIPRQEIIESIRVYHLLMPRGSSCHDYSDLASESSISL